MEQEKFLGTGMKFPPQINPATGRFAVSAGAQSVKESIYLILMTQKSERMVRPSFGSTIAGYTFMDMTETMMTMMAREMRSDILKQEPRISGLEITMKPIEERGCLIVNLSYTIIEEQRKDNMVFPFYFFHSESDEI